MTYAYILLIKIRLCAFDDKIYSLGNGKDTLAHGHKSMKY